jgi:hypothetical protein
MTNNILTACACQHPRENLQYLKQFYSETKDLHATHQKLQEYFRNFIQKHKNLSDEQVNDLITKGWGMAGIFNGQQIIATKIPKHFHEYFQESDPQKKRGLYCHCPRVCHALLSENTSISPTYCLCGAGFYQALWEEILGHPVTVRVLKSVLQGDDVCQIEINL